MDVFLVCMHWCVCIGALVCALVPYSFELVCCRIDPVFKQSDAHTTIVEDGQTVISSNTYAQCIVVTRHNLSITEPKFKFYWYTPQRYDFAVGLHPHLSVQHYLYLPYAMALGCIRKEYANVQTSKYPADTDKYTLVRNLLYPPHSQGIHTSNRVDIIETEMCCDQSQGTISFVVGGIDCGVAWHGLTHQDFCDLFFSVTLSNPDAVVTFQQNSPTLLNTLVRYQKEKT
jgi:hypothetical protein